MRLAMMTDGERTVVAIEKGGQFYSWEDSTGKGSPSSILELILDGSLHSLSEVDNVRPLDGRWRLMAPFPRPLRNIICLGKNYAAHAEEFAASMGESVSAPPAPIVFTKATTSVSAPDATVVFDADVSKQLDYEVELAVVIGRRGRRIPRGRALEHVAGYTIINDLTARDLQKRHNQWFLGKSLDGACPMGPVFVTADEIPDLTELTLSMHVDGELRQHASTRDMIFDVPTIIETLSNVFTLEAGDIIATGTPEGVALGFDPPRFLQHGSIVEAHIDPIGTLKNRIEFVGVE